MLQANLDSFRAGEQARAVEAQHPTPEGLFQLTAAETESLSAAAARIAALANEVHKRTGEKMQTTPGLDKVMRG